MNPREAPPPRTPQPARPPRMARLATLPLFFKLDGKRVVVAGGSEAAAWKAELLSAAGASVEVYAAELSEEMLALAREAPQGPITLHPRAWTETSRGSPGAIQPSSIISRNARHMPTSPVPPPVG